MFKRIEYLSDYEAEAELRRASFGRTDKYQTGFKGLDAYLGAGFGNEHGYEIITVFGETGVGKSSFVLNMVAREMVNGTKMGLMILEDDMPDVYNRIRAVVGDTGMQSIKRHKNVDVLPSEMLEKAWTFDQIIEWISDKHTDRGIDLFIIDHINFIFDHAEVLDQRKELSEQRRFMRNLNFMCRKYKLTIILVSHTSKGDQEGMAKVYGTTAITQVSTKVIGVKIAESGQLVVTLFKTRFTMKPEGIWQMERHGLRLQEFPEQPVLLPKKGKK